MMTNRTNPDSSERMDEQSRTRPQRQKVHRIMIIDGKINVKYSTQKVNQSNNSIIQKYVLVTICKLIKLTLN
jgi:hypothetical protein